jgi:hypothetical protein
VFRLVALVAVWAGCSGDDPACDSKEPDCESSLVVLLPDDRTDFLLTVTDDVGLDVRAECPELETDTAADFGDYVVTCGGGRLTIETFRYFAEEVTVQLGAAPEIVFTPDYQRGGDACGNPCNTGTIQL